MIRSIKVFLDEVDFKEVNRVNPILIKYNSCQYSHLLFLSPDTFGSTPSRTEAGKRWKEEEVGGRRRRIIFKFLRLV